MSIPLPDLIAQQQQVDPADGLGPDMGVSRPMNMDTAGYQPPDGVASAALVEEGQPDIVDLGAPAGQASPQAPQPARGTPAQTEQDVLGTPDVSGISVTARRRGSRAGLNEKYRYTNEDFYGPRGNDITWTDPRGVQMIVPRAGELPVGIWASRVQALQSDLQATRKAMGALMDSTRVAPTADPYQPDFARLLRGMQNNIIGGVAQQYGGDTDLAAQEIGTEGTDANRLWKQAHANAEAVGQFVKFKWADSADWIKGAIEGKIESYPPMRERANELYYGIGSLKGSSTGGDFAKVAQDIGNLERDMNLSKYVREVVVPNVGAYYAQVQRDVEQGVKNGQRVVKRTLTEEVDQEFYDRIANEAQKLAPGLGKEYIMDYVEHVIPRRRKDTEELSYKNLPKSKGSKGSSKDGGEGGGVTGGWGYQQSSISTKSSDKHKVHEEFEFVSPPMDKVGDRLVTPGPVILHSLHDPKGAKVEITGFERRGDGQWWVLGRRTDIPEESTSIRVPGESEGTSITRTKKETPNDFYEAPLSQNKAAVKAKYGTANPYKLSEIPAALARYNAAKKADYELDDFATWPRKAQENLVEQYGR